MHFLKKGGKRGRPASLYFLLSLASLAACSLSTCGFFVVRVAGVGVEIEWRERV